MRFADGPSARRWGARALWPRAKATESRYRQPSRQTSARPYFYPNRHGPRSTTRAPRPTSAAPLLAAPTARNSRPGTGWPSRATRPASAGSRPRTAMSGTAVAGQSRRGTAGFGCRRIRSRRRAVQRGSAARRPAGRSSPRIAGQASRAIRPSPRFRPALPRRSPAPPCSSRRSRCSGTLVRRNTRVAFPCSLS